MPPYIEVEPHTNTDDWSYETTTKNSDVNQDINNNNEQLSPLFHDDSTEPPPTCRLDRRQSDPCLDMIIEEKPEKKKEVIQPKSRIAQIIGPESSYFSTSSTLTNNESQTTAAKLPTNTDPIIPKPPRKQVIYKNGIPIKVDPDSPKKKEESKVNTSKPNILRIGKKGWKIMKSLPKKAFIWLLH